MGKFDPGGKARFSWRYVYGKNPSVPDLRGAMRAELGRDPAMPRVQEIPQDHPEPELVPTASEVEPASEPIAPQPVPTDQERHVERVRRVKLHYSTRRRESGTDPFNQFYGGLKGSKDGTTPVSRQDFWHWMLGDFDLIAKSTKHVLDEKADELPPTK